MPFHGVRRRVHEQHAEVAHEGLVLVDGHALVAKEHHLVLGERGAHAGRRDREAVLMHSDPSAASGVVRIGVGAVTMTWFPDLVAVLRREMPNVHHELDVDMGMNMIEKLEHIASRALIPVDPLLKLHGNAQQARVRAERDESVAAFVQLMRVGARMDHRAHRLAGARHGLLDSRQCALHHRVGHAAIAAHVGRRVLQADEHRVDAIDFGNRSRGLGTGPAFDHGRHEYGPLVEVSLGEQAVAGRKRHRKTEASRAARRIACGAHQSLGVCLLFTQGT
ncbi:hypothetical protein BH09PSE5_BH09PSE5_10410 [soil metagenome]